MGKRALAVDRNNVHDVESSKGYPVKNIEVNDDRITFFDKCISCQRCVHKCPANAFYTRIRRLTNIN